MEGRKPGDIYFTSESASQRLERLGYEDISKVPIGRGNDYLTALVRISRGEFKDIDFNTVIKVVRVENNARENTPDRF